MNMKAQKSSFPGKTLESKSVKFSHGDNEKEVQIFFGAKPYSLTRI